MLTGSPREDRSVPIEQSDFPLPCKDLDCELCKLARQRIEKILKESEQSKSAPVEARD